MYRSVAILDLHSFPTRRSSDLAHYVAGDPAGAVGHRLVVALDAAARVRARRPRRHVVGPLAGAREIGARHAREARSEEHTSELQSLRHLVCSLLLEKKKERTKS